MQSEANKDLVGMSFDDIGRRKNTHPYDAVFDLLLEEEGDNKGNYPAISSENPYPFLLASYKADQIMKKPEDLLEKKSEDKK